MFRTAKRQKLVASVVSPAPRPRIATLTQLDFVRYCGLKEISVEWSSTAVGYELEHAVEEKEGELVLYLKPKDVTEVQESQKHHAKQHLTGLSPKRKRENRPKDERRRLSVPLSSIRRIDSLINEPQLVLDLDHPPKLASIVLIPDGAVTLLDFPLSLDPAHACVAPFVGTSIRCTFKTVPARDELCCAMSKNSGAPTFSVRVITRIGGSVYRPRHLDALTDWMTSHSAAVAFQIAALLYNGVLDASQLHSLLPVVHDLVQRLGDDDAERTLVLFHAQLVDTRVTHALARPTLRKQGEVTMAFHKALESAYLSADVLALRLQRAEEAVKKEQARRATMDAPARYVTITPTRFILSGPISEQSNSVLRTYGHASHFLRINLCDEAGDRFRNRYNERDALHRFLQVRYQPFLSQGLKIAGRTFDFLAYSSSGLKESSCYFVAPFDHDGLQVTGETIRNSLGDFSHLARTPAKWMARIAQAFTTTQRSVILRKDQIERIPDVERKDQEGRMACFTDGAGTISRALAMEVDRILSASLTIAQRSRRVPATCFQFRLGGAKGVLSVDNSLVGSRVCLRPSQIKFESEVRNLSIAESFDRPFSAYLNKPLIKILEDLGCGPQVFLDLQMATRAKILAAQTSSSINADLLDDLQLATESHLSTTLLNLASYIMRRDLKSTFIDNCTALASAHALRELKYRARIFVPGSWSLVGVPDPSGYLSVGEVYACIHEAGKNPVCLKGRIAISRSPTMDPGDIQVVRAVGELPPGVGTAFSHLKNCVVFSTQGSRSLPSCLAGGDLDGDLFLLLTDSRLIPPCTEEPAAYNPPELSTLERDCTISDGAKFFLEFSLNDRLGAVSTRHFWIADFEVAGVRHVDCIKLGRLHSDAVDYAKTGTPVREEEIPLCRSKIRPDHLANEARPRPQYASPRVLGTLFRSIRTKAIEPKVFGLDVPVAIDPGMKISSAITSISEILPPKPTDAVKDEMEEYLRWFSIELIRISRHGTIVGGVPPDEVELFVGVRRGKGRQASTAEKLALARVRDQTKPLFDALRLMICPETKDTLHHARRAWASWHVAIERERAGIFGTQAFAWVALGVLLDCLVELE